MRYDFDTQIDRHNSGSNKWSKYPADVLPMWVADMDFAAAPSIVSAITERLQNLGATAVILTQGSAGATWCAGTSRTIIAAPRLPVVDTTGAGDCLAGWFIAETLRGADPAAALNVAVTAATMSCGAPGAQPSFPIREAVERAIAQYRFSEQFADGGTKEKYA